MGDQDLSGKRQQTTINQDFVAFFYNLLFTGVEGIVLFDDAPNTFYLQLYWCWICNCGNGNGNVLFNDALNTFYLRLYGVRHMVKDHSDSERGNPLPPHRLLFPINSKGSFICTIPQTG